MLSVGCFGVISVISHLVGRQVRAMIQAHLADLAEDAAQMHRRLLPLIEALFLVTNPIPVKYAMGRLGFSVGGLRLPLCEPDEATAERIMAEVQRHQIDLAVAV
jgi:4-hydroxy-tetrahydrodipicolinate synthase